MNSTHSSLGDSVLPYSYLEQLIQNLQEKHGSSRAFVAESTTNATTSHTVNSIVFRIKTSSDVPTDFKYVLAILPASQQVSLPLLQKAFDTLSDMKNWTGKGTTLYLCPSQELELVCGFLPGAIPPIGHSRGPYLTLLDKSLYTDANRDTTALLQAGGGKIGRSCFLAIDMIEAGCAESGTHFFVAPILHTETTSVSTTQDAFQPLQLRDAHAPIFPVQPPDPALVRTFLAREDPSVPVPALPVSVVGRVTQTRRKAKELVFCDLSPPQPIGSSGSVALNNHPLPWMYMSANISCPMSVQLIAGQTLCRAFGPEALKPLVGLEEDRLILVQGYTSTSRPSLENWVNKSCLDIVLHAYTIFRPEKSSERSLEGHSSARLTMEDLQNDGLAIHVVDDMPSIETFSKAVSTLLNDSNPPSDMLPLVGLDSEWKPSMLLESGEEAQPVLLLQVCLHPIRSVFLLDLQALLRPLSTDTMNTEERELSGILAELLQSKRLVKVGFQLGNDLLRLAASYPRIPAFQVVHSVLDVTGLAKQIMRKDRQPRARFAVSSLSRLSEALLGKSLDKREQCSDWSKRPLTVDQISYAALDAAVTPAMVEKLLRRDSDFVPDTSTVASQLMSSRFLFLDENTAPATVRKLNARRVVGEGFVVSQHWRSREKAPEQAAASVNGIADAYRDQNGFLRYQPRRLLLKAEHFNAVMDSLVGQTVGRSKDQCLDPFIRARLPEGSRLDFPPRSGFVETVNAVFLFVNSPSSYVRGGQSRSYPNEFLDNGKNLTWFIRSRDWNDESGRIRHKLLGTNNEENPTYVSLFLRVEKDPYLCCGRCSVTIPDGTSEHSGSLVQLVLELLDWESLMDQCEEFRDVIARLSTSVDSE